MSNTRRPEDQAAVERAASLLRGAKYPIALTGAGISVPSGIPDFRSPGSGMWEKHNPAVVASIHGFREDPSQFYDWIRPLLKTKLAAFPNPGHKALTTLQQADALNEIITQNIDGLHEAAGSERVLPLHGHTQTATCMRCHTNIDARALWDEVLAGEVPYHSECGGVFKPDVVLYGEMLPDDLVWKAQKSAEQADVMLIAGSSLETYPVALFPKVILERGGHVIIVNLGETEYDDDAAVLLNEDVATALPAIAEAVVKGGH